MVGVDFSDEAIAFARSLSAGSGIAARFVEAEVVGWMETTDERFDLAFASYGATGWLPDLGAWARGVHRILRPGGALVYVEFHPIAWSFAPRAPFALTGDDYFSREPFVEPVGDYVARSGAALGAIVEGTPGENDVPATSWQHGLAEVLQAVISAGLRLERVAEWPYSNGCRLLDDLAPMDGRRWTWPPGIARIPLMYGLRAAR